MSRAKEIGPIALNWCGFIIFSMLVCLTQYTLAYDRQITGVVQHFVSPSRTIIFNLISITGSPMVTLGLGMLIALFFIIREDLQKGALVISVFLFTNGIGWVLKDLLRRPRPLAQLTQTQGFSYPSSHVMGSLLLVIVVLHFWHPVLVRNRVLQIVILSGWFGLVCLSRIYLQAHFLTDVIGGAWLAAVSYQSVEFAVQGFVDRHTHQDSAESKT
ncbi:phosphatase PAP2 family protein [Secundilactobacillus folii]|uniref:Phosphatase PAP2 family protein n=1 Tax=Secundilactobacillus folii TaxID=2678357 RepID=A0A7X2XX16_9LACO|nr:phosphatase PAP2 family protein [Secundilactobacillus folii]MTV81876.1 phosphatase PAP2 family protein [Secundilactobacillus folii]